MFPNAFNFNMISSGGVLFYRFLYCICLGKFLLYSYLLHNFSFVEGVCFEAVSCCIVLAGLELTV